VAVGVGVEGDVAVGGIGVRVKVAVETGVGVRGGIEGIQAVNKTKRKMQNPERVMKVSVENRVSCERCEDQGLPALICVAFGVL
jgi:hypothetical protein